MQEQLTPETALADERFVVLQGDEGEELREWLAHEKASELPELPDAWAWAKTAEPMLIVPPRWQVRDDGSTVSYDAEPTAEQLWDWVERVEETSWFACEVLDTWTGEKESRSHTAEPPEPGCHDGREHRWESPIEIVGGIDENPGVWGHGGGVKIHQVCRWCGRARHTDTWAHNPGPGEPGLTSVRYEEADRLPAVWAAANRLDDALAASHPRRALADAELEGSFPDRIDEAMVRRAGLSDAVEPIIGSHLRREGVIRIGPLIRALPRLQQPGLMAKALRRVVLTDAR